MKRTLWTILLLCAAAVVGAAPNPAPVARAAAWGFDPRDATAALQAAINSGARRVIVENMKTPWILGPIELAGDQELVLERGVVLEARRGGFKGKHDCLLRAMDKKNVRITGPGATIRMWRGDYDRPPYEKAEWRHAIAVLSCSGVSITGVTIAESGGDGIYLGVSKRGATSTDVTIRDVICDRNYRQGISVISAENLLIENTVLRATSGTAPMAGIDFEPNHPSERLVNCVMRNCLAEGNVGAGYTFYLNNLGGASAPISIRLENCRSLGNRAGFRFSTANAEPGAGLTGTAEVIGCRFEGSRQAGIGVSGKPATGCRVRFAKCLIVNPAPDDPLTPPVQFASAADNTQHIGGVEFEDCLIRDDLDRRPLGFSAPAGGVKLVQLRGALTVERAGRRTVYPLEQKILDAWFPLQAYKEFAPFRAAGLEWTPLSAEGPPRGGWACPARQRIRGEYLVWAEAGQKVAMRLALKQVGNGGSPRMPVTLLTPAGEERQLPPMAGEGEKNYAFTAGQAGAYRLVCEPGSATVRIAASSHRVCLYAERAPLHLLGGAGDLYFCVPAGAREFALHLSGGGGTERVRATVHDAAGRRVAARDDIEGHQFLFSRPAGAGAEVWRLRLEKPSHGVIEDCYLRLQGIAPLLAATPAALLHPAAQTRSGQ